jgi:hypothetical protein
MNRRIALALVVLVQPISALAVAPAGPVVVRGIDHIKPNNLDKVLKEFCETNNCHVTRYTSEVLWDIVTSENLRPVTIGDAPFFKPHRYFVETWGDKGCAYMNEARTTVLKKLLNKYRAKFTPKNNWK